MDQMKPIFLSRTEVQRVTGFSIARLYHKAEEGSFPKPVKIGARRSGWVREEVEDWARKIIAERDARDAA